jgi:hypothetical protein
LEDRCLLSAGLDANQSYIQALYQDDLGRTPSTAELSYWVPVLVTQGMQAAVNGIENSTEARTRVVDNLYLNFLGRNPHPFEEQYLAGSLGTGASVEGVAAAILGSTEFYNHSAQAVGSASASDTTFVQALFQDLLLRTPSSNEVNSFTSALLPAHGRQGVGQLVLSSPEYRTDTVRSYYGSDPLTGVLHRPGAPTGAEVSFWVYSSLSLGNIHAGFEGSYEKFLLG